MTIERRYVIDNLEARGKSGEGAVIAGHAAVFNRETVIHSWFPFREQVAPGAFSKTIQEADVRALFNHDPMYVLGRNKSGTLRLSEDKIGLVYEVDIPDTQQANDLYTLIERGDVSQSSFAFEMVKQQIQEGDAERGELPLRTILEVKLFDVSPVTYPAYEDTDIDVKAALRCYADHLNRPFDELLLAAQEGRLQDITALVTTGEPAQPLLSRERAARELEIALLEWGAKP